MVLYLAELPPTEADLDGSDQNQWFDTLAGARKFYNAAVKELRSIEKKDVSPDIADYDPGRPRYFMAKLWRIRLPEKRSELARQFNHDFAGCRELLAEWPQP